MNRNTKIYIFLTVFLVLGIGKSEGANILFFHQIASYSHRVAVWPLLEELTNRGHNVTFHSIFPPKSLANPKIREFMPKGIEEIWKIEVTQDDGTVVQKDLNMIELALEGSWFQTDLFLLPVVALQACQKFLSYPETQEFVKNNHFDLVVVDMLFNDCAYGLAHKWGAKTILYYTSHPSGAWSPNPLGFLDMGEASWIPDIYNPSAMPINFFNRVITTLIETFMHLQKEWYYYPGLTELFKEKLDVPNIPPVSDLVKNTSLAFYNSHFSEEHARSLPPMYISGKIEFSLVKATLTS